MSEIATFRMWQTPFFARDLRQSEGEDVVARVNIELLELIASDRSATQNDQAGVIAAVKSSFDLLQVESAAVGWLKFQISKAIAALVSDSFGGAEPQSTMEMVAEAWAVSYLVGGSHRMHSHHDSGWSGIYYVDTDGVGEASGYLQLLDPRPAAIARSASGGVMTVRPTPGLIVAFPGWLAHSAQATMLDGGSRVCIPFNVGYRERSN